MAPQKNDDDVHELSAQRVQGQRRKRATKDPSSVGSSTSFFTRPSKASGKTPEKTALSRRSSMRKNGLLDQEGSEAPGEQDSDYRCSDRDDELPHPPAKKRATSTKKGAKTPDDEKRCSRGQADQKQKPKRAYKPTFDLEPSHETIVKDLIVQAKVARKKLKEKLHTSEMTCRDLKQKLDEQTKNLEDQVRITSQIREEQLERLKRDKVEVEIDSEVTSKCSGLFRATKDWAKDFSISQWTAAIGKEVKEILQGRKTGCFVTTRLVLAVANAKIKPSILLNALVNTILCNEIFQRPFAHFSVEAEDVADSKMEACLNRVLELAKSSQSIRLNTFKSC